MLSIMIFWKFRSKFAEEETEVVTKSHPKYIAGVAVDKDITSKKQITPSKTFNTQIKYSRYRHENLLQKSSRQLK